MRIAYNILFTIFFWLSAPFYFLKMWRRGNWREGFEQRFGRYSNRVKIAITNGHTVWIHAVSVGEVNLCTQLIRALEPKLPNARLIVSTTTSTGMAELQKRLPSHIVKVYYPVDFRKVVVRALSTLHPQAIILVEAEIWPNFLWRAHERGTPIFLVNARLSDRSYRGYKRFGFLFRPLFGLFRVIGVQNENDAARLRELGCRPEAIQVVGNMKYDAARIVERSQLDAAAMLRQVGVNDDSLVLVAGSTHAGEEVLLAEICERLCKKYPTLFLVLVPRHFERGREVGQELEKRKIAFIYRSEVTASTRHDAGEIRCLLVNSTGELRYFYETATVVFVGKSITAEGGQNPLEPGSLGKAMIFGPNMQNFAPIVKSLLAHGGAVQVKDAGELESKLEWLLSDAAARAQIGNRAVLAVRENQGAIGRTVEMICSRLSETELFVQPDQTIEQ